MSRQVSEAEERGAKLIADCDAARDFPANTCAASRHAQMIGEALVKGESYPMLQEEPEHCGESILATVTALWKARTELKRLSSNPNQVTPLLDSGWRPISEAPRDGQFSLGAPASQSGSTLQPSVSAAIPSAWVSASERLPEIDGTIFVGINDNGYACCFNNMYGDGCVMESPEDSLQLMSGLAYWMPLQLPTARGMESRSGKTEGLDPKGGSPVQSGTRPEESAEPPALDGGEG